MYSHILIDIFYLYSHILIDITFICIVRSSLILLYYFNFHKSHLYSKKSQWIPKVIVFFMFYSNEVFLFGVFSELKRREKDSALTEQLREQLRDLIPLAATWRFEGAARLLAIYEFNEEIVKVMADTRY